MTSLVVTTLGSIVRTTDGVHVLIRAYGRDEHYVTRHGLEMFAGYLEVAPADLKLAGLWAQHQILASFMRSRYGEAPVKAPLTYNVAARRWECLTGGQWQPIAGLPEL